MSSTIAMGFSKANSGSFSVEEVTTLEKIRSKLQTEMLRKDAAGQESRKFIPEGSLQQLLRSEDITNSLRDPKLGIPWYKIETTKSTVLQTASKVFAILIDLGLESKLIDFIEHDLLDSSLPASKDRLREVLHEASELFSFEQLQWDYFPYRISRGQYAKKIPKPMVFPYTEQTQIGSGGFSTVYRVVVHPDHQDLIAKVQDKSEGVVIVRKEITPSVTPEQTTREAELLFLLGSIRHKNIVELFASYTHNGITSLLFPLADSDLHIFLLQQHRPVGFVEDFEILKAAHGLSSGLLHLHHFIDSSTSGESMIGYHHDIKPRNVLIQNSNFVLADFGLSGLKPESENSKTQWKETTIEYGAPECRNMETFVAGTVGRALDIWSLGCVLSEIGTYIQDGSKGVESFREKRLLEYPYGTIRHFHDGESISDNVRIWIEALEEQTKSTAQRDLVTLLFMALQAQAEERPDAKFFEEETGYIAIEALVEALIQSINCCFDHEKISLNRNVYKTRLKLERTRLEAWAGVLGLIPIEHRRCAHDKQIKNPVTAFYATLLPVCQQLKTPEKFNNSKDNEARILSILSCMNDDLCSNLSPKTRASIDSTFLILSTSDTADVSLTTTEMATLQEFSPQLKDIGSVAAMKYMSIQMTENALKTAQDTTIQESQLRIDKNKDENTTRPQTYWYTYGIGEGREELQEKVIIERQWYGMLLKDIENDNFKKTGEALFKRNQEMVVMLKHQPKPPGFRVLDCIGTFHDTKNQSFGIVYRYPSRNVISVRLSALLRQRGKKQEIYPGIHEKLTLAKALVSSIHNFHVSGWVHKDIASYNILFFPISEKEWKGLELSKPYVVGFHHSRKDEIGEYTYAPASDDTKQRYQHPKYRDGLTGYVKHYDYYSLGLLLLEIGLWTSLTEIYKHYPSHKPHELLKEYTKFCNVDLKRTMGQIYAAVTINCLESDTLSKPLDFQLGVVDTLESCVF